MQRYVSRGLKQPLAITLAIGVSAAWLGLPAAEEAIKETPTWPTVNAWVSNSTSLLTFSISNRLDRDFNLMRVNVPWLWPYTVKLSAFRSNSVDKSVHSMTSELPIMDPPIGDLRIPPHTRVIGSLNLSTFFPELRHPKSSDTFIISWRYARYQADPSNTVSGVVVVAVPERRQN